MPDTSKRCNACGETKPVDEFPANGRLRSGEVKRTQPCKQCKALKMAEQRKAEAEAGVARDHGQEKVRRLAKALGMSVDDLNALMDRACDVCGAESGSRRQRNSAYRKGGTGEILGTVCQSCASGIGYFEHDPERIERALTFLRRVDAGR
ncbi:hypothetical protein GCM10027168_01850 [Streptomyces capparidis]